MTLSPEMSARVAARREDCFAALFGDGVDHLTDEEVAAMLLQQDAENAALAAPDRAEGDARLAALGLRRDQIVTAVGFGWPCDVGPNSADNPLSGRTWRVVARTDWYGAPCVELARVEPKGFGTMVYAHQIRP